MARINIEDEIFKDRDFGDLCVKAGGTMEALGVLVFFWIHAQKHFLKEGEIPSDEWNKLRLPEYLIETGWAKRTKSGVKARGQNEQFAWLTQTREAGKASAKSRSVKSKPIKHPTIVERPLNERSTHVNDPSSSYLLSLSSVLNTHNSDLFTQDSKKKEDEVSTKPVPAGLGTQQVIARYCEVWKQKYNAQMNFTKQWAGNATTLVKDHGAKKAIELVEAFMEMRDPWFLTKRHAFDVILSNIAAISHFASTGKHVSQAEIRDSDRTTANHSSLQQAKELIARRTNR